MKVSKGSVFQRKGSQYLYINLSIDGKRIVQKTKYKIEEIEKVRQEILPLIRAKILSGEITLEKPNQEQLSVKTFSYYSEFFLKVKELTVKPNTLVSYTQVCKDFNICFKNIDIKDIKASDIKRYLLNKKTKISTMKLYLTILKDVFNEAIMDRVLIINPCSLIKLGKKEEVQVYPFQKDEVQKIIENSTGCFRNLLATAFYTGARSGELFALKWQNIDFEKKLIYIDSTRGEYVEGTTKTSKARFVPIFDMLVPFLKAQQKITGLRKYVFLTERGKNLSSSNLKNNHWKPLLKRLNIPYRNIYTTRHTFATTLLNSGSFSLNQIAAMLGHQNISTLIKHYNKYIESEINKIDTKINPFCDSFCDNVPQSTTYS